MAGDECQVSSVKCQVARLPSTRARYESDTTHIARRYLANDRAIIDRRVGISSLRLPRSPKRLSARETVSRLPAGAGTTAGHNHDSRAGLLRRRWNGSSYRLKGLFGNVGRRKLCSRGETRLLARGHL